MSRKELPMLSPWAKNISSEKVLLEYPRPQMVRPEWLNLNGLWRYAVTHRDKTNSGSYQGEILVPFAVESALSGVNRPLNEQQRLWYQRRFSVPANWRSRRVLLHFGAVDWETRVWLNGQELGIHRGGYDSFSFDITDAMKPEAEQELVVSVFDPTESGLQPRGKQALHPHDSLYSACSGIWQTVWLEPVEALSIDALKLEPDMDAGLVSVVAMLRGESSQVEVEAVAREGQKEVARLKGAAGQPLKLALANAKLWSPQTPFLYDLTVTLFREGRKVDEVTSYFGMRKVSVAKTQGSQPTLLLNNKPVLQVGPMDAGYWPDGLYTAPTDEALRSDIEVMKQMGFNACRKHLKVEPERWYYWCDRLGLLVWQDMPASDRRVVSGPKEIRRKPESAQQFELELQRLVAGRGNHPCIVTWAPFNEGWGQYETDRIVGMVKALDPSRLVLNPGRAPQTLSGEVFLLDFYPGPGAPELDGVRAWMLGECGGLEVALPNHLWKTNAHYRPGQLRSPHELVPEYQGIIRNVQTLAHVAGLSGAFYWQLTDVENDLRGLLTYDRVLKVDAKDMADANKSLRGPTPAQ